MSISYFDSKRYLAPNELQTLHALRCTFLTEHQSQTIAYGEWAKQQSLRYRFERNETWIEETFEAITGDSFTFYHELLERDKAASFWKGMFSLFGYVWGGRGKEGVDEQILIEMLCKNPAFSYERHVLTYTNKEQTMTLFLSWFPKGNVVIKYPKYVVLSEEEKKELHALLTEQLRELMMNMEE